VSTYCACPRSPLSSLWCVRVHVSYLHIYIHAYACARDTYMRVWYVFVCVCVDLYVCVVIHVGGGRITRIYAKQTILKSLWMSKLDEHIRSTSRFQLVRESERERYEFVTLSRCFRNRQYTNHSEWGRWANKCYVCIHVYIICICIPLGMLHMYTCVYYTYMYTFGSTLVRRKYMACLPEYRDA